MTDLTRRTLLAGAAAAAAAPFAASSPAMSPAHAAAPPAGKQAPGYLSLQGRGLSSSPPSSMACARSSLTPARSATPSSRRCRPVARRELPAEGAGRLLLPSDPGEHRLEARADRHRQRSRQHPDRHRDDSRPISPPPASIRRRSTSSSSRISTATISADCAPPTARWPIPMPRSWCRRRSGRSGSDEGNASRAPQGQQATFQNTKRIFGPIADKMTKYEWGKEVAPGITGDGHQRPHPGPHLVRDLLRLGQVLCPGRRHRRLRAAHRRQSELAGRRRHGRRRRRKRRGASSTTCSPPSACWSRAITSRSRRSATSRRRATAIASSRRTGIRCFEPQRKSVRQSGLSGDEPCDGPRIRRPIARGGTSRNSQ